jgi:hypothetical protein
MEKIHKKLETFFQHLNKEKQVNSIIEVCNFIDEAPTKSRFSHEISVPILTYKVVNESIIFTETYIYYISKNITKNITKFRINDVDVKIEEMIDFINTQALYFDNKLLSIFIDLKRIVNPHIVPVLDPICDNNYYTLSLKEFDNAIKSVPLFETKFKISNF